MEIKDVVPTPFKFLFLLNSGLAINFLDFMYSIENILNDPSKEH